MRFLLYILVFVACSACALDGPSVEIGGQQFSVELAQTREQQALGLMYRLEMPENHGMLFIFPAEEPRSFWMKNTRIPLDILYFDNQLRLVSAALDTPPCRVSPCPTYPSIAPARYVLELNAGKASELGIKQGDRLKIRLD